MSEKETKGSKQDQTTICQRGKPKGLNRNRPQYVRGKPKGLKIIKLLFIKDIAY
jgi:hypothetical protein